MADIEGFPEQSMTGQFLKWGRANSYAPSLLPSTQSVRDLKIVQELIQEQDPTVQLTEDLHSTILYCPPKYLLEAVKAQTGRRYDIRSEASFYADVSNGLSTMVFFPPAVEDVPTEGIEIFDDTSGTIVLRLAQTALISRWRQKTRELLGYNLHLYHGVTEEVSEVLATDPKLKWLFNPSEPHITLASGYSASASKLADIAVPESVMLAQLIPVSPHQFLGANSLLFNPDEAFEAPYSE